MDALIAGLASGALMASIFVTAGTFMAFAIVRDPPPTLAVFLARFPPGGVVLTVVAISYPLWGGIGLILAVLFIALENGVPDGGLGSPNIAYSLGVTVAAAMLAAPVVLLLRRVWPGVVSIALFAAGIFGWFLPFLAG
ncbi:MAG: hypothetical protein QF465_07175 [SAR202 cluster bacterium]|nr:hypothetical protein [SAR202 cluster bacterium]